MLQATSSPAVVDRGRLYVRISLQFAGYPVTRLCSGYVTQALALTWPPGRHEGPTEGTGRLYDRAPANPAAGQPVMAYPTTNSRWRILAFKYRVVTSAAAADRYMGVSVINDATGTYVYRYRHPTAQTASTTRDYYLLPGYGTAGEEVAATHKQGFISPNLILRAMDTVVGDGINYQAGDQISFVGLWVEEWIEV